MIRNINWYLYSRQKSVDRVRNGSLREPEALSCKDQVLQTGEKWKESELETSVIPWSPYLIEKHEAPDQTRFSYSNEDFQTRDYITKILDEMGMKPEVDCVGNIRAKYNPQNLTTPSVMAGSHIDTVKNGGLFDGLLGVLSFIETIQTIQTIQINSVELAHPIELVIFAEEEGSNFNVTMLGSKIMSGKLKLEDLKKVIQ